MKYYTSPVQGKLVLAVSRSKLLYTHAASAIKSNYPLQSLSPKATHLIHIVVVITTFLVNVAKQTKLLFL